ncbi:MAG: NUDIX domain-containing protein [Tissierellia bacterium]|nr:NUDIX domain-containing protein [Tissierellia bacterium]
MEHWDLYDKNRIKMGKPLRRGKRLPKGRYRLVVHVCIFNSKDEMLIQQRQPFDHSWGNLWDFSAGGSASSGNTSQKAIERELYEELGIRLSFKGKRPSLTVPFEELFDDIYIMEKEIKLEELKLDPKEVQDVKWASLSEILKMIDKGTFIPYHKSLIELLFAMRKHPGTHTRTDRF